MLSSNLRRAFTKPTTKEEFHASREYRKGSRNVKFGEKTPVLLFTDIGADIDDTLALLALLSCRSLEIKAIVTSVNDGVERGRLTRGWLRKLRLPESLPIFPSNDSLKAACVVPKSFPSRDQANLSPVEETPQNILNLCKDINANSKKKMIVMGIASLTPLWNAIKLDKHGDILKAVGRVYLQGNVDVVEGRLVPNSKAYNFRNDMKAAAGVLEYFQDSRPMTFLGKNAAYKVEISKANFKYWNTVIEAADECRVDSEYDVGSVDLLDMAYRQMNGFRLGNKEKFAQIYPDSVEFSNDDSLYFFEQMEDTGVLSHPYDPLLALACIEDLGKEELKKPSRVRKVRSHLAETRKKSFGLLKFTTRKRKKTNKGNLLVKEYSAKFIYANEYEDEEVIGQLFDRKVAKVNGINHEMIGNDGVDPEGVPDVARTHKKLIESIGKGLQLNAVMQEDLSWMSFSSTF